MVLLRSAVGNCFHLFPVSGNAVMLSAHLVDNDNKLQSHLYYGPVIQFGTRSIVAREKKLIRRRRLRRNLAIQITLLGHFPKKDATKQIKEKVKN